MSLPQGDYFCPLCMKTYSTDQVKKQLTEEDVPQASLGGSRIILTCRNCNSTCGSTIDNHLFNAILGIERRKFISGTSRRVLLRDGSLNINGKLDVSEDGKMQLSINTKHNNPTIWNHFHKDILLENNIVNIENSPLKRDIRRISAAILKNAYYLLYSRTGCDFLFDPFYDRLREQILNPDPYILPERLWTFQHLTLEDGIYLTRDNRYRGFLVIYTLKHFYSYKVCAHIPVPTVEYM